jgi:hypothetical protein
MNVATRLTILLGSLSLCVGGLLLVQPSRHPPASSENHSKAFDGTHSLGGYRFAAGDPPDFDLKQIETAILLHDTIKSGCNRVEFGTLKVERGTAQVEVFYFSADQRMLPFLYKLISENHSWKIVSVERMWSVSRSRAVRGLRA